MSEALDLAAQNLRIMKAALRQAEAQHESAVAEFKRELAAEYGDGRKVSFVASDGYKYGRTYAEVGGGLDFEALKRDDMALALMVGKLVVDADAVERVIDKFPEVLPKFQKYALPTTQQERVLSPKQAKVEESDD